MVHGIDGASVDPPAAGFPVLIQGGMGVGVSGWRLASAVAATGHLGVVSGVALDAVLARRLQLGDPEGHVREALAQLPVAGAADRILRRYFVAGGLAPDAPFRPVPRLGLRTNPVRDELTVAGNFVEVYLAKRGHSGLVGINYLEKIQLATTAAMLGAILAGADYVLMGAGIPTEIPRVLSCLARGEPGELNVAVAGAPATERHTVSVNPGRVAGDVRFPLSRPRFLAIVSSAVLATDLARDPATTPDGFVLESPSAGGHSAPPRGPLRLDAVGEPVYGPRDAIDLNKVAAIGRPFWVAGGHAAKEALSAARAAGAAGIQVGTAFALCRESGIDPGLRRQLVEQALAGTLVVRNDPFASPTGFPFKTVELAGTLATDETFAARTRLCDLGYLRLPYSRADSAIGYRCPAEPVETYLRKGGSAAEASGLHHRDTACHAAVRPRMTPDKRSPP